MRFFTKRYWAGGGVVVFVVCVALSFWLQSVGHGDYPARAQEAAGNGRYLELFGARRDGDPVTVAGRADSDAADTNGGPYTSLSLDGVNRSVVLSGARANVCHGDLVAVSGTYHYSAMGGWIDVSDARNVATRPIYAGRSTFFRIMFPRWCL